MGIGKVMVKKQRTSDLIQQKIWTGDLSCVEQVAWLVSIYFVETGEVWLNFQNINFLWTADVNEKDWTLKVTLYEHG